MATRVGLRKSSKTC